MKKLSKHEMKRLKGGNGPSGVSACSLGTVCTYRIGIKEYQDICLLMVYTDGSTKCNCGTAEGHLCPSPDSPDTNNPPHG